MTPDAAAKTPKLASPPWLLGTALKTQPDHRLVTLVREGNERAFEEVVRRYRASLLAYAGAITTSHRADDVLQESLSKAFFALQRNSAEIDLRPWLYKIVRNTALNDLRANRRTHEQLDENYDGVEQPPQALERREAIAGLVLGIQALPEQQREALVQRELAGMGHSEIAETLNVSPGAVRQLIFRARRTLREGFGLLLPLPLLRILASSEMVSVGTEAAGAGAGIGIFLKGGIALFAVGGAVVAGTAVQHQVTRANHHHSSAPRAGLSTVAGAAVGPASSGSSASGGGAAGNGHAGAGGNGGGSSSGAGGGPAGSGGKGGSRSGQQTSGDDTSGGSGHSGPGGGDGSGDSGSGDSGSSGSGDSGSSGSGDSGDSSGSGDSGSSGSGESPPPVTDSGDSGDGGGDGSSSLPNLLGD